MLRFLSLFLVFHCSYARHLQFQLSGYECFYEDIDEKTECSLEFAPITGNDPKIDVSIEDPNGGILYKIEKKDYDLHKFTTKMNGTYRVCFSNVYEFAIGDNLVYFDFITGKDTSFDQTVAPSDKALTQLETSLATIHENMNLVERYQNYHRLREANGRLAGEHLNQRDVFGINTVLPLYSLTKDAFGINTVLPLYSLTKDVFGINTVLPLYSLTKDAFGINTVLPLYYLTKDAFGINTVLPLYSLTKDAFGINTVLPLYYLTKDAFGINTVLPLYSLTKDAFGINTVLPLYSLTKDAFGINTVLPLYSLTKDAFGINTVLPLYSLTKDAFGINTVLPLYSLTKDACTQGPQKPVK
ncbi:hypothetical protein QZH41_006030 [Actinostola sp. cb2023]|nr:hypothetical protein QZH41_006030 [Actinostola sp. cb2023]